MLPVQSLCVALFASSFHLAFAAPAARPIAAPAPTPAPSLPQLDHRDLVGDVVNDVDQALSDIVQLVTDVAPTATGTNIYNNLINDFKLAVATQAPIGIEAASRTLSAILSQPTVPNVFEFATELVAAGLTTENAVTLVDFVAGALTGENSMNNVNLRQPFPFIYPKANARDAPYSLPEATLRGAIYIPPTFRYGAWGAPPPVILIPGTGDTGYTTFVGNFIPLLQQTQVADPVWLNIPGYMNDDAQVNAEYIAYAINYISGICGNKDITIAGWSQGNIGAQWALKYWPSTRSKVCDHIAMSPDYHGTIIASFAATPEIPLPASYLQQEYNSNFITTLRNNGGDSAYVPTTTIYSGIIDEIVEPQQGANASAYLLDARNVGVTNNEVQAVCPGQPAGLFYTHEGVMYNPISWALFVDAIQHYGPGQTSRIDKSAICSLLITEGLDLADFLLTENTIPIAALSFALDPIKLVNEPPIKSYART